MKDRMKQTFLRESSGEWCQSYTEADGDSIRRTDSRMSTNELRAAVFCVEDRDEGVTNQPSQKKVLLSLDTPLHLGGVS